MFCAKGKPWNSHQATLSNNAAQREMRHERPYRGLRLTTLSLSSSQAGFPPRAVFVLLSVFLSAVAAAVHDVQSEPTWSGYSLLLDQRAPPIVPSFMPPADSHDDDANAFFVPPSRRSLSTDPKGSKAEFDLPKPLDTGLSSNFTSSCASFLNRMRSSDSFTSCHPFSLMLQVGPAPRPASCIAPVLKCIADLEWFFRCVQISSPNYTDAGCNVRSGCSQMSHDARQLRKGFGLSNSLQNRLQQQ